MTAQWSHGPHTQPVLKATLGPLLFPLHLFKSSSHVYAHIEFSHSIAQIVKQGKLE
jgi:hypothetical protein